MCGYLYFITNWSIAVGIYLLYLFVYLFLCIYIYQSIFFIILNKLRKGELYKKIDTVRKKAGIHNLVDCIFWGTALVVLLVYLYYSGLFFEQALNYISFTLGYDILFMY